MGEVTRLMADAAQEAGAEIRCDAEVERIVTTNGRATQVLLADGTELSAGVVLSNADPKRTFEGLLSENDVPDEFLSRDQGLPVHRHQHQDQPRRLGAAAGNRRRQPTSDTTAA